jgi:hypothetical protein
MGKKMEHASCVTTSRKTTRRNQDEVWWLLGLCPKMGWTKKQGIWPSLTHSKRFIFTDFGFRRRKKEEF